MGINGSFFYPFTENTPWDYYPHGGESVNALGESISNGKRYGQANEKWSALCFSSSNLSRIIFKGSCPIDIVQGIAGKEILVEKSKLLINSDTEAYGRSAVGINKTGDQLCLIMVDGKQPFYSEGVTQKNWHK